MSHRWIYAARPRLILPAAIAALLALGGGAATAQAALPTLNLSLTKTAVTVSGATQSGAVNVVTASEKGLKEPEPILIRLNTGVTAAQFDAFLASTKLSDPNVLAKVGSIVFDAQGTPGGNSEAQTILTPGTYEAANVEGQGNIKPVHSSFTVTTAAAPAALPAPAAIVKTIDFAFKGPRTLKVGQLVRFENEGFLVHMDIAFPTKSHAAAVKLANALLTGKSKGLNKLIAGPPASFAGPLSPGGMQQEVINAKPGWYVQACFMETQDHREHTRIGMERIIKITK